MNILLVDDQPENLVALEAMLEPLGQVLLQARSGRDALRILLETDVAVVLLDVRMPDMDGFETAELIRSRERSHDTPIIFLTAADQSLAGRGYALGAVDYIVKPAVPEFVRSKVAVFVELARKNAEARDLAEQRARLVADLEHKNRELETFSYAVSHDLRAPLRRVDAFARALVESTEGRIGDDALRFVHRIREATGQMQELIDALLHLASVTRSDLRRVPVDLSAVAADAIAACRAADPERSVDAAVQEGMRAEGDPRLLRIVLANLVGNAFKFTAGREPARVEVGVEERSGGPAYFVRDNGAGFDMTYADRLFRPFQRLHPADAFAGTGIGLATVQRIVHRHGGRVWADGSPGRGAEFWFTLTRS